MKDIVSDLETLGTSADSVILSIGAVKFNKDSIGDSFFAVIDINDSLRYGRRIDQRTLQWWFDQSKEAVDSSINYQNKESMADALMRFKAWFDHEDYLLWGNGASFDNAILEHAFTQLGEKAPWEFFNSRCYRTLKKLAAHVPMPPFQGTPHNALDDSINQAMHIQLIMSDFKQRGLHV